MLKQRLLTAAVLIPLLLAAIFLLPNAAWRVVLLFPLAVAAHEWARLASYSRADEAIFLAALAAGIAAVWAMDGLASGHVRLSAAAQLVLALSVGFWLVVVPCWLWLHVRLSNRWLLGAAGIAVLVPTWVAFAQLQRTPLLFLLLLAVVWIADTAAYFFGHQFGRHKLAPAISPGKTWEGVAGALATVTVYALILQYLPVMEHDERLLVPIFVGMTAFSIAGDLLESWLKRGAGVKDSGTILPGHGGMLDRIDALTAAMPLAALIFAR
jgi:phosphatidate cytidylyltransferase